MCVAVIEGLLVTYEPRVDVVLVPPSNKTI